MLGIYVLDILWAILIYSSLIYVTNNENKITLKGLTTGAFLGTLFLYGFIGFGILDGVVEKQINYSFFLYSIGLYFSFIFIGWIVDYFINRKHLQLLSVRFLVISLFKQIVIWGIIYLLIVLLFYLSTLLPTVKP